MIDKQYDLDDYQGQDRGPENGGDIQATPSQAQDRGEGDDVDGKEEEDRRRQNHQKLMFSKRQGKHQYLTDILYRYLHSGIIEPYGSEVIR
jgi:hypothetical protein